MTSREPGYHQIPIRGGTMGNEDKLKNSAEGALGKAKEKLGATTDD